ncbi:hypothetical protein IPF89_04450 [Candidatus Saccharibacteria bacterium]|nr:MAG: hypothetical protein IPF89_04450 [Candidatus Saccharibacteria bacterium]
MDAARAQGMMDNPNVWQNLNEDKRNVLRGVAGTNGPSNPAGAATAATGTSGSGAGQMPMPNQAPPHLHQEAAQVLALAHPQRVVQPAELR